MLSQSEVHHAAVNFDTYQILHNKSIMEHLCMLNTPTVFHPNFGVFHCFHCIRSPTLGSVQA